VTAAEVGPFGAEEGGREMARLLAQARSASFQASSPVRRAMRKSENCLGLNVGAKNRSEKSSFSSSSMAAVGEFLVA
jgi:hypothetical protein